MFPLRPQRQDVGGSRQRSVMMSDKGPYDNLYAEFFKNRDTHKGYDFQHAPTGSAAPPVVTFMHKLRWWSWDRWRRRKRVREERDRRLQEIVRLGQDQKPLRKW